MPFDKPAPKGTWAEAQGALPAASVPASFRTHLAVLKPEPEPVCFVEGASACYLGLASARPRHGLASLSSLAAEDFLMSLLISVLITFLVVILVLYLVNMLPIDGRVKRIIHVVVIIVGVLSLLRHLGVWI
jgi:hypothetical protein